MSFINKPIYVRDKFLALSTKDLGGIGAEIVVYPYPHPTVKDNQWNILWSYDSIDNRLWVNMPTSTGIQRLYLGIAEGKSIPNSKVLVWNTPADDQKWELDIQRSRIYSLYAGGLFLAVSDSGSIVTDTNNIPIDYYSEFIW